MTYRNYPEYLESAHWEFTRKKILERDAYKCVVCKKDAQQVHHINYRSWFDVIDTDLMSVCEECHCRIHVAIDKGYIPMNDKSSLKKTLFGLDSLKHAVPLTKQQRKEQSRFILDKDFCSSIDKLSGLSQQLICGVLKRRTPISFTAFAGLSVSRKVYHRILEIKRRDRPPQTKSSRVRKLVKLNPNPSWLQNIRDKLRRDDPVSDLEMNSYNDLKRMEEKLAAKKTESPC